MANKQSREWKRQGIYPSNEFETTNRGFGCFINETGEAMKPALVFGETKEDCEANAKLIAAAPKMLEALQDIRDWYEEHGSKVLKQETPICFSVALSAILSATDNN